MSASDRIGDLLRELAPQVLGVLLRRYGGFEECEEAVQDALPWGQIPLFSVPRALTQETVSALACRKVTGWEQAHQALTLLQAEHGL
ncbi:hypothetical protein ACIBF1_21610 [Spirillospora sp. NPDC050679]